MNGISMNESMKSSQIRGKEGIRKGTEQWETRLQDVCNQVTEALNDKPRS